MSHGIHASQRWLALYILCLGVLMIVLDSTIVNVALPSIREDLHFTETSLVWVVNAYLLTFGGFLLLVVPGIIVSILWYVAIPAAVMEGKNVSEAMSRSTRLTEGSRWQIFASWLVVGVITAVVGFVVVMVLMATAPHLVDDTTHRLPAWANIAIGLLLAPLGAVMSATCYFLLRTGKEHADADQIAAVFD